MSDSIQAVILAGGLGSRLRPYTRVIPKPLVSIHGVPIIEIALRQLARSGLERVVVTLGHEADLIRAHLGNGSNLGLKISYAEEESPLGTAGPLATIENLEKDFLVMNSDLITDLDFAEFLTIHQENDAMLTIATHQRTIPIDFGVLRYDENDRITGYLEKPNLMYVVSMGIYAFNKSVLEFIEPGKHLDFPDLVLQLLQKDICVRHHHFDGYWLDIGSGKDYERALEEFPQIRGRIIG